MNRIQKISWLNIICCGTALILSSVSVAILFYFFGFPVASAGLGFLGISGFTGLGAVIFKKDPGAVSFDERDHLINSKAARAGFVLSYLVFILVCMGLWGYYQFQNVETISINILPMLVWPPFFTALLGHAVAILILYGKDNKLPEGGAA
jgi:hypothetical protein